LHRHAVKTCRVEQVGTQRLGQRLARDPADISAPVLLVHGQEDRVVPSAHSAWLAARCPSAELWLRPGEGHISVMSSAASALHWLVTDGQRR
jgi:pimeloyl-ACP methyl ester carboxylesterase